MISLSARFAEATPSPLFAIAQRARAMAVAGVDVISMEQGEMHFDMPAEVVTAVHSFISRERVLYTDVDGTPALKRAIQNKLAAENNLDYELDEMVVGAGASQIIFNAFGVTLGQGDEVIIPVPAWPVFGLGVKACQGTPVFLAPSTDQGFGLHAGDLEKVITDRTRWLILNSPANPSGAMYSTSTLLEVAEVLRAYPQVAILSDDLYEHQVYDGRSFVNIVQVAPDLKERTLVVNGVSKTYSMTGWRIGWGAGSRELARAMKTYQALATSSPSAVSQAAAYAALTGPQEHLADRRLSLQYRRDLVVDGLRGIPRLSCPRPEGAFYVYPYVGDLIGGKSPDGVTLSSDTHIAEYLLDSAGVATVPGSVFGFSPYLRMSYALPVDRVKEACDRIRAAVEKVW